MERVKAYYWLAKPGIVFSNVIAAIAGSFLASSIAGMLDISRFLGLVSGVVLVIASACVFNNYLDRDIDKKMKRTSWRVTAKNEISWRAVFAYLGIMGASGFIILGAYTNWQTLALVAVAYFFYVVVYGYAKRKTVYSTLIGTIPGGIPPAAGYTAVAGAIDHTAGLLFLVMVCWQMAHFYAIGMRRRDDYAAANLPVMPVVKGMHTTKIQIIVYIVGFIAANVILATTSPLNNIYLVVVGGLGVAWVVKGLRSFKTTDDQEWAKRMFLFSLVVLLSFCGMVSVGALLP